MDEIGQADKLRRLVWEEAIDKATQEIARTAQLDPENKVFEILAHLKDCGCGGSNSSSSAIDLAMEKAHALKVPADLFRSRPLLAAFEIVKALNADKMRAIDNGSYKIFLNLGEYNTMLSRAIGFFERSKFLLIESVLRPGDHFADLGGNKGDFALFASTIVGSSGKVICFEPVPENALWIRRSSAINDFKNIDVVEACVTDEVGEVVLNVGKKSGWSSIFQGDGNAPKIVCKATTLDEYLREAGWKALSCAKIDIEGAELKAIKGARNVLSQHRPIMFVDVHRRVIGEKGIAELEEIVVGQAYKILDEKSLAEVSGKKIGTAAIFVPVEKEELIREAFEKVTQRA